MEGVSKKRLIELFGVMQDNDAIRGCDIRLLIETECKELDPWLPIAGAPKDRELAFITKEYGKVIGKWFSVNQGGGGWVANCMPITPTYYKELPPDPKE